MNLVQLMRTLSPDQLRDILRGLSTSQRREETEGIVRRTFGLTVKAGTIDEKTRSVRVVASTEAIDSYDEIVTQDWEKRLDRYLANPVVLWNHNVHGILGLGGDAEDDLPIGFSTDVGVFGGRLEATFNFVDEKANPIAEKVWQGFLQGSIRAVSVGFIPHTVVAEKVEDREVFRLSDNELFEISAVPMGANKEAVRMSAERQAERDWLRSLAAPTQERIQDNTMDIEQLKAQLEQAKKDLDAAKAAQKSAEDALAEAKKSIGELTEKLSAETDARKKAEAELIKLEVDSLVGKKITPAEVPDMIELRTEKGAKRFAEIMERRPDLELTNDVSGEERPKTKNKNTAASGKRSSADVKAAAKVATG